MRNCLSLGSFHNEGDFDGEVEWGFNPTIYSLKKFKFKILSFLLEGGIEPFSPLTHNSLIIAFLPSLRPFWASIKPKQAISLAPKQLNWLVFFLRISLAPKQLNWPRFRIFFAEKKFSVIIILFFSKEKCLSLVLRTKKFES